MIDSMQEKPLKIVDTELPKAPKGCYQIQVDMACMRYVKVMRLVGHPLSNSVTDQMAIAYDNAMNTVETRAETIVSIWEKTCQKKKSRLEKTFREKNQIPTTTMPYILNTSEYMKYTGESHSLMTFNRYQQMFKMGKELTHKEIAKQLKKSGGTKTQAPKLIGHNTNEVSFGSTG